MAEYYSDEEDEDSMEEVEEEAPMKKKKGKKFKDANKPKRAMSAYFLYSQAMRHQVKEDFPEAGFGEVARILARQFKELPDKERKKWDKKAEADKARYKEEMKTYVPAEDPSGGRKRKAKKDPNAPKRNMSAYFLYSIDSRPKIKEQHPEASFGDIARLISDHFKKLSAKEKKHWDDQAALDKVRYEREMADYNA